MTVRSQAKYPRPDLPAGTLTFLFTDVEGSTKLLHSLGQEQYARALSEHRLRIRDVCASHGGVEVDTQGDAFFFAFPAAPNAATSAREATERLQDGPIHVRMGLHTGTPLLTDEGYVGHDVHLAARIAASGHGGQVLVSSSTADAISQDGAGTSTWPLIALGEHRLKDMDAPVAIFQLGDGRFPPLKTIANTNLPRPASSFIGRQDDLAAVLAKVKGGARLVTLTGPGGSGKTRLAIEAATSLVPEYKAGVFWVGLAAVRDPLLVLQAMSETVGAKDGLAEHISEREMLLLLDNVEQVVDAAPELSTLLSRCPNLMLLVTSRELLRIQGEVEFPVPVLDDVDAMSLFCERAQTEASDEIVELCRRLDRLPLAIELAAAWATTLTPAQILVRLDQRLDLLRGGRDVDPRQQTLRATIEWSYDLLSDPEQRLFERLSVFMDGCTFEAAEAVADADPLTLRALVEKSLVRSSTGRYWMLETIREYALERLVSSETMLEFQRRHADWFAELAEQAEPHYVEGDRRPWLERIEQERGNFRAALRYCAEAGLPALQLRLAAALGKFWFLRGELVEGQHWLGQALANGSPDAELRVKALASATMINLWQGRVAEADELAQELWALAVNLDAGTRAEGLHLQGTVASFRGEMAQAVPLFERSAELSREAGNDWLLAQSINNLGDCALNMDDKERAESCFRDVLAITHSSGNDDPATIACAHANLGMIAVDRADPGQAIPNFVEALEVSRAGGIRDPSSTGSALVGLAWVAVVNGDPVCGGRLLAAADAFLDEVGGALQPFEKRVRSRAASLVRDQLTTDMLAAATDHGRGWSLDDAIEQALAVPQRPGP